MNFNANMISRSAQNQLDSDPRNSCLSPSKAFSTTFSDSILIPLRNAIKLSPGGARRALSTSAYKIIFGNRKQGVRQNARQPRALSKYVAQKRETKQLPSAGPSSARPWFALKNFRSPRNVPGAISAAHLISFSSRRPRGHLRSFPRPRFFNQPRSRSASAHYAITARLTRVICRSI